MAQIINYYQEQADQALTQMHKAIQHYEATQGSDWLEISLEWEIRAYTYLSLADEALEFI